MLRFGVRAKLTAVAGAILEKPPVLPRYNMTTANVDPARSSYTPPPPGLTPLTPAEFRASIAALRMSVKNPVEGFFPANGMAHEILGHNASAVMGLAPLLLEVAHFQVGFSVAGRSTFTKHAELRGLMTFLTTGVMAYGSLDEATRMSEFLYLGIHSRLHGALPRAVPGLDVTEYSATDPAALLWVAATLLQSSIDTRELFVGPLRPEELERLYEESKTFFRLCGVPMDIIPQDYQEFRIYYDAVLESPSIYVSPEAKETCQQIFANISAPLRPYFEALAAATLPPKIRDEFGLPWNDEVARRAQSTIRFIKIALQVMPERAARTPLEGLVRLRMGQGDSFDRLVRVGVNFSYAWGREMKVNQGRSKPLSRLEILRRARKNSSEHPVIK